MTALWKAMQQDNVSLRRRLGSGDPELTVILGGYLVGEGTDTTFSSTPIGAYRVLKNPKKDVILRGQSASPVVTGGRRNGGRDSEPSPNASISQ